MYVYMHMHVNHMHKHRFARGSGASVRRRRCSLYARLSTSLATRRASRRDRLRWTPLFLNAGCSRLRAIGRRGLRTAAFGARPNSRILRYARYTLSIYLYYFIDLSLTRRSPSVRCSRLRATGRRGLRIAVFGARPKSAIHARSLYILAIHLYRSIDLTGIHMWFARV